MPFGFGLPGGAAPDPNDPAQVQRFLSQLQQLFAGGGDGPVNWDLAREVALSTLTGQTAGVGGAFGFAIPGGGTCPTTLGARPFSPDYTATTDSPKAGAYTPFRVHVGRSDGKATFDRRSGTKLAENWNLYIDVCAASDGVIYGLTASGDLYWTRHTGRSDGTAKLSEAVLIASGWNYSRIFAAEDSVVYAVV